MKNKTAGKRSFFYRYWWVFAGVLSAVALSTALNIDNTDGWIVVTNTSNESWTLNWNTSRPVTCAAGNYSYWTGTGFSCRDDNTGGGSTNLSGYVPYTGATQDLDLNGRHLKVHAINATDSAGLVITSFNLLPVASFGVGSTNNSLFYGSVTFDQNICVGGVCRSSWPTDTYANVTALQGSNSTAFALLAGQYENITDLQAVYNYSLDRAGLYSNVTTLQTTRALTYTNMTNLNTTKAGTGSVNCGSGTLLQNLTLSSTGVTGQCYTDQTGGGGVSDGNKGDITVASSGTIWYLNNATVGINKFTATGTPSATTFLRGDNTWATPSATGSTSFTNWTRTRVNSTQVAVWLPIADLTATLSANSNYSVDCVLLTFSNLVTTGEQVRVNFTGALPTNVTLVFNSQVSATTRTSYQGRNVTADNVFADTGSAGTNILDNTLIQGRVRTGASATTINYATKTEINGNNSAVEEGSWCMYQVLS